MCRADFNTLNKAQESLDRLDALLKQQNDLMEHMGVRASQSAPDTYTTENVTAEPEHIASAEQEQPGDIAPTPDIMTVAAEDVQADPVSELAPTPGFSIDDDNAQKLASLDELLAKLNLSTDYPSPDYSAYAEPKPSEAHTTESAEAAPASTVQLYPEPVEPDEPVSTRVEKVKPDKKSHKIRSRITGIIFYAALVAIVILATTFSAGNSNSSVPRPIFGFSAETVLTDSMQSEIPQGSLVIVQHVDPNTLQIGDDITYMYGEHTSITHKVVGIYENFKNGERGFLTKGVDNQVPDPDVVLASSVVGKVIFHAPAIGQLSKWVSANIIMLLIIFIGLGILLYLLFKGLGWLLRPRGKGPENTKMARAA